MSRCFELSMRPAFRSQSDTHIAAEGAYLTSCLERTNASEVVDEPESIVEDSLLLKFFAINLCGGANICQARTVSGEAAALSTARSRLSVHQ